MWKYGFGANPPSGVSYSYCMRILLDGPPVENYKSDALIDKWLMVISEQDN